MEKPLEMAAYILNDTCKMVIKRDKSTTDSITTKLKREKKESAIRTLN
jgi:hypothetical protein